MTQEEIRELATALKTEKSESSKMSETFFKFISTASFALVAWLFSNSNQMQKDIVEIKSDTKYTNQKVEKIENFTQEPRFTKDDFLTGISPIIKNIENLNVKTDDSGEKIDQFQKKYQEIEIRLQMLEMKNK